MGKLLSICIPTYNRYPFISRLINHLLEFDRTLFNKVDIVVSDNCSSDETETFFQNLLAEEVGFLKYYRNETNIGATRNLEKLLDLASSEYIWWFGDDDWMEEDNLRRVLQCFSSKESPSLIVINRAIYMYSALYDISFLGHYFKHSFQATLSNALNRIGPLTSFGCISAIIFKKLSAPKYPLDLFYKFKTSLPHVGYLIANFYNDRIMYDIHNKIKTRSDQRVDGYEHNNQENNNSFSWKQNASGKSDIIPALAFFIPIMLNYLMQEGKFSRRNLFFGKEYWCRYTHRSILLSIAIFYIKLVNADPNISLNTEEVKKFYKAHGIPIEWMVYLYKFVPGRGQYKAFFKMLVERISFSFFTFVFIVFSTKRRFLAWITNKEIT